METLSEVQAEMEMHISDLESRTCPPHISDGNHSAALFNC